MMAASDSKRLAYLMQGAALRHEQASLVKPLAKLKAKHSKAVNALESKAVLRIRDVVSADKMVSRKAVHAVRDAVRRDLTSWHYEPPLPSAHDLLSTAAELMSQLTADADDACVDARERCAASAAAANSRLRETSDRRSLLLSEAAEAACGVAPARERMDAREAQARAVTAEAERRFAEAAEHFRARTRGLTEETAAACAAEQRMAAAARTRAAALREQHLEPTRRSCTERWRAEEEGRTRRASRRQEVASTIEQIEALKAAAMREGVRSRLRALEAEVRRQRDVLASLEARADGSSAAADAAAASAAAAGGAVTPAHEERAQALVERLSTLRP